MTPVLSLGIDFGGTTVKCAAVRGGEILKRTEPLDTQKLGTPERILDALAVKLQELKREFPGVVSVGAGLPGMIDPVGGIVHELSNVPGWESVPMKQILTERTGLPAAIDNDAKSMAYAEWRYGAAVGRRNVVCVTLGTGVGGALILDGKLYRGAHNGSGEIGQTSIHLHGEPGVYGNMGALEKYVGNQQITARAQARYHAAGIKKPLEQCTPKAIAEAAEQGDAVAVGLWKEIGTEIGVGLANVIWLLNPDCIVIGGGVAKAGPLLFEPIRSAIQARTMPVYCQQLQIVPAILGNDAGVIGAAAFGADFALGA